MQHGFNFCNDRLRILHDLMIGKTKYLQTVSFKSILSFFVIYFYFADIVNRAIYLNNQFQFEAKEIYNVNTYWMLPSKLIARGLCA
jgi:hypothetical protein